MSDWVRREEVLDLLREHVYHHLNSYRCDNTLMKVEARVEALEGWDGEPPEEVVSCSGDGLGVRMNRWTASGLTRDEWPRSVTFYPYGHSARNSVRRYWPLYHHTSRPTKEAAVLAWGKYRTFLLKRAIDSVATSWGYE